MARILTCYSQFMQVLTSNISTTGNENPNHPEVVVGMKLMLHGDLSHIASILTAFSWFMQAVISDNEPATNVMQVK